jgi:hypothetical protein
MANELQIQSDAGIPSYLTGKETSGLEALGREDFKVQRIKLLQPLSPEVRAYQGKALPSNFWHTGANLDLGDEFLATPIIVNKKVILFAPRDVGNDEGILAISMDGKNWSSGANQTFEVRLNKGDKELVKWSTGKDVVTSGLTKFGSSNPFDNNSQPAATLFYEYLFYIVERPELSPAVLSVFRTGIPYAQSFNTYLASRRIPINCNTIKVFSKEETKGKNIWHVTRFEPAGNAPQSVFQITEDLKNRYANYEVDISRDDVEAESAAVQADDI